MFLKNCASKILTQNLCPTPYRLSSNANVKAVNLAYNHLNGSSEKNSPLVVLHGLFGNKTNWSSIAKALNKETRRNVICVDCRNHGQSPHSPEHTYEHMVEDIRMLMKELRISKPSLMGHSMGGRAVMHFALKYPDLVEKLIVADISPVSASPQLHSMYGIFVAMEQVDFPAGVSLSACRRIVDKQLARSIDDGDLRTFLIMNVIPKQNSFMWRINIAALKENFPAIATFPEHSTTFKQPTLFLGGEKSDYIPSNDHKGILSLFPNAEIKYIAKAGHLLHVENPGEYIKCCIEFLSN